MIIIFNNREVERYKVAFEEELDHNSRLKKRIIEARMELYLMFPDKITEISDIFQKYKLE